MLRSSGSGAILALLVPSSGTNFGEKSQAVTLGDCGKAGCFGEGSGTLKRPSAFHLNAEARLSRSWL